jgi:iron only hydrogenase large subunit-like protein
MFGAILKTYYAEKNNIDAKNIYVVSVMPCVAKKFERQRPEMKNEDLYNVDAVITTRELAKMISNYAIKTLKKKKDTSKKCVFTDVTSDLDLQYDN